jgi:hypothetical protein
MSTPTPASPAGTYFLLLSFRAFALLGGILFSLPLHSPSSLVLHTITLLLLAAECRAAQRSLTASSSRNQRQEQFWTAASLALYAATSLALAGCFLAPRAIWSPFPGTFPQHDDPAASRILYLPDLLAAVASAAAFFTLPALRSIRYWHALPQGEEEGLFVRDDGIPVAAVVYDHPRDYHEDEGADEDDGDQGGETGGLLAATFRAQKGCWKDDDSVVTLA